MYLGDPRENAIDIDNHVIWEADNRIEERYQWNALLTDLCDMTPEEYMKNPISDAISSAIGDRTDELVDAINEKGDEIVEAINNLTGITPGSTTLPPVVTSVKFYYASLPRTMESSEIMLSMFKSTETDVNAPAMVQFTLGDPDQSDFDYIAEHGYSDESKREVQRQKANTYYIIVPDEYSTFGKIMIKEEGFVIQESDIVRDVEMVNPPVGYKLIGVSDIDNFNFNWPSKTNVKTIYEITLIKN